MSEEEEEDNYEDVYNDVQLNSNNSPIYDAKNYDISKNITKNILSKYEKTLIIIMRCEQINSGSLPFIRDYDKYDTIEEIVKEELKQNKIPFIIERNITKNIEYWKLEDLQ